MSLGDTLPRLATIMDRLLGPDGCPWDREQTLASLRPYLLEETYEVLDALDDGRPEAHREELGDLLFQIVFQAAIRQRAGAFDLDGVIADIADKLERRHPHVFASAVVDGPDAVARQWATLKAQEKKERTSVLDGLPSALPALARAARIGERAAQVGFDWPDAQGPRDKIDEELAEVAAALEKGDPVAVESEVGDVLFAVVNWARKLGVDPEQALAGTNRRFTRRFRHVETLLKSQGKAMQDVPLAELDRAWEEAKRVERVALSDAD